MRSKPILRLAVFAALAVVCGLCGLTAYSTVTWLNRNASLWDLWEGGGQSAQVNETLIFDVYAALEITSDFGDVQVAAADVDGIEVELVKTAWAQTVEEAEARAGAITVRVTENADRLTLVYEKPDEINLGFHTGADSVDFIVRVPAETSVDLKTSFGEVRVSGLTGNAVVESNFGNLEVEDLTGALVALSSNASIHIARIEAGEGEVEVSTSFGEITLEDVTGANVSVRSRNGPITIGEVTARETVLVENQFGNIEITDVRAVALEIDNDNGQIRVEGGQLGDRVTAANRFGGVHLIGVAAPAYTLSTSNGDVTVEGASGSLDLETSFGDIVVLNAVDVSLDIQGSNGAIEITGTLAPTEHTIRNTFGDVTLTIPEDSAFSVVLETEFGDIRSEIPLSLTGTLESESQNDRWEAEMNGGGPLLDAKTSNGDVVIHVLTGTTP